MSATEDIARNPPSISTPEHLQEYANLIKQRAQYYKEENIVMEEIFKKLKFLDDKLELTGLLPLNLDKIIAEFEIKSLNTEKVKLEHAEKLKKCNNYLSKMKTCIRHYSNLNENISKHIKFYRSELELSKQNMNNVLKLQPDEIKQLEEKAKRYENELIKFEKKYPWLRGSDYDLPNIAKHFDTLKALKEEKDNLLKELSNYQNLKPDLKQAKQQLAEIKEEMKSVMADLKM